jgi:hypothetical protein
VATVYEELFDAGLTTGFRVAVELRKIDEPSGTPVLFPIGQWENGDDLHLSWPASDVLEISVPNRTIFTREKAPGLVKLRVSYRDDDPVDRSKWISAWDRRGEWMHDGRDHGDQPSR